MPAATPPGKTPDTTPVIHRDLALGRAAGAWPATYLMRLWEEEEFIRTGIAYGFPAREWVTTDREGNPLRIVGMPGTYDALDAVIYVLEFTAW